MHLPNPRRSLAAWLLGLAAPFLSTKTLLKLNRSL